MERMLRIKNESLSLQETKPTSIDEKIEGLMKQIGFSECKIYLNRGPSREAKRP